MAYCHPPPLISISTPLLLHQQQYQPSCLLGGRTSSLRLLPPTTNLRTHRHRFPQFVSYVNANAAVSETQQTQPPLSPEEEDQENVRQILRVLDILKKKRDMPFNEVRLTVMIEDPREVERRKRLGIEDERGCSREDLGAALLDVYEGRIPSDRVVLRELTKDMLNWPNLEDELEEETNRSQSPYARVTETGVDPRVAAKRSTVDWDAAADIMPGQEDKDAVNVPPALGFGVLYIVTAIPIFIGISVVAILFFNSLR